MPKTYIIGEVLVMVSRELKVTMLEAVDNQLSMNEPKCTKDTFERLIASGCSPQEAKESIAEVLLDRITASLATGEAFDEADFSKQLASIEGKRKQNPATFDPSEKNDFEQLMNEPVFMTKSKGTPVVNEPKIGRNDPCPCGSGKKYKKCCGK